jgi:hypothetical protein
MERMDFAIDAMRSLWKRLLDLLACIDLAVPTWDSSLPYVELLQTYAKMRAEGIYDITPYATQTLILHINCTLPADQRICMPRRVRIGYFPVGIICTN